MNPAQKPTGSTPGNTAAAEPEPAESFNYHWILEADHMEQTADTTTDAAVSAANLQLANTGNKNSHTFRHEKFRTFHWNHSSSASPPISGNQ